MKKERIRCLISGLSIKCLEEGMAQCHALFPCRMGGVGPERIEAHFFKKAPIRDEACNSVRQHTGISLVHEKSVLSVPDDLGR